MEGLNEKQKQEILRRRQEMLSQMGVPNGGRVITESLVANSPNASMAAKLNAIKNGAAKNDFSKYVNAKTSGSGPGEVGFQGIPEPKKKRNPNAAEGINPEYRQNLETFERSGNSELDAIESLFGSDGRTPSTANYGGGYESYAQNPMTTELNIDNIQMPSFNPHAALQQKAQKQQMQSTNPYLKYASETPQMQQEQFVDNSSAPGMPNMNHLQMMMETIAKGIAEKTIRTVLNEYSEQQKGKLVFEFYNKEKGIVRGTDGKLYKLQPVVLTKK